MAKNTGPEVKLFGVDNTAKVLKNLVDLKELNVYVGIPDKTSSRKGSQVTNAQLAYMHTHGVRSTNVRRVMGAMMINRAISYSQAHALYLHSRGSMRMAIPPRPIIEPAIEAQGNKQRIAAGLKAAGLAALDNKKSETLRLLNRLGLAAQNMVRAWFTDPRNNWAPNAPSTIKRKGSSRPLINKGELRKSITYVLSK